jgi:hypothetical protein
MEEDFKIGVKVVEKEETQRWKKKDKENKL